MGSAAGILDVARRELGTAEDPPYSNRVKYSAWYGLVGPWCDMFVSWCAAMSANSAVIGRFAYTPTHEAWFRSQGREVPIRAAQPGDIVFFNFIGRTSHVGIVEAPRPDGLVTLEGNTNGSGSRDGGSVMRHFRSWSSGLVSAHRPLYESTSTSGGFGTMTDAEILKQFENVTKRDAAIEDEAAIAVLDYLDARRKVDGVNAAEVAKHLGPKTKKLVTVAQKRRPS